MKFFLYDPVPIDLRTDAGPRPGGWGTIDLDYITLSGDKGDDSSCSGCHSLWLFHAQVKQIMEEAVTKKFVHEDSSHIIALCSKYASLPLCVHTHTHTHTPVSFHPMVFKM